MKNILTAAIPSDTLLSSINTYLGNVVEKGIDKIDKFLSGYSTVTFPYLNGIVKGDEFAQAIDDFADDVNSKVKCWTSDVNYIEVAISDVSQAIGDSVISADLTKEFVNSISGDTQERLNEGSAALRSVINTKYGALSENCSKFVDALCSILENQTDKMSKLRGLFSFCNTTYTQGVGFKSEAEDITGVNPWVVIFCGPMPDFSNVPAAIASYYSTCGRIIGKFYQICWEGIGHLFSGLSSWIGKQINPFDLVPVANFQDYSLDTTYWARYISESSYSESSYPNLYTFIDYLYQHDGQYLCIPTLGATFYFVPGNLSASRGSRDVTIYVKKHIYNYESSNLLRKVSSYQGNTVATWESYCANISSLAPCIEDDSAGNENNLFNGLLQAESLIPLGIALISSSDSNIGQVLSAYADGTIDTQIDNWMSPGYSPYTYFSGQVTNLTWKNEYEYGEGISDRYLINTLMANIIIGVVNNNSSSTFTPYCWVNGQLIGCARIKSDNMNVTQVQQLLKRIGVILVVATVVIGVGVAAGKLKAKAFAARRQADLAAFNESLSDSVCRKLEFKANMLAKASGLGVNAAINAAPTMMNAYTGVKQTIAAANNIVGTDNWDLTKLKSNIIDDTPTNVKDALTNSFTAITTAISGSDQNINTKFQGVDTQFSTTNGKIDGVPNSTLQIIQPKLNALSTALTNLINDDVVTDVDRVKEIALEIRTLLK